MPFTPGTVVRCERGCVLRRQVGRYFEPEYLPNGSLFVIVAPFTAFDTRSQRLIPGYTARSLASGRTGWIAERLDMFPYLTVLQTPIPQLGKKPGNDGRSGRTIYQAYLDAQRQGKDLRLVEALRQRYLETLLQTASEQWVHR